MIAFNAMPLEKYSSMHTIPLIKFLGIRKSSPLLRMVFNFNLRTTFQKNPQAQLTFYLRDADIAPSSLQPDFCIHNLTRWRLNLSQYDSFFTFLKKINRNDYRKYCRAQKIFNNYGASFSLIENDWSTYADIAHGLYLNVAKKHGAQLYDLNFFRSIAKMSEYKLLCVWYRACLIGMLVIIDEGPVIHSMVCGFDYLHSKKAYAYSQLHYELIRLSMEANKHTMLDIGLTADHAKAHMGFQPVSVCMDVYARNVLLKGVLHVLSYFINATINPESKLELNFNFANRRKTK